MPLKVHLLLTYKNRLVGVHKLAPIMFGTKWWQNWDLKPVARTVFGYIAPSMIDGGRCKPQMGVFFSCFDEVVDIYHPSQKENYHSVHLQRAPFHSQTPGGNEPCLRGHTVFPFTIYSLSYLLKFIIYVGSLLQRGYLSVDICEAKWIFEGINLKVVNRTWTSRFSVPLF